MTIFTEENFLELENLAYIIFPFHILIKEFERDDCMQFRAVPLFEQLVNVLTVLSRDSRFSKYSAIFETFFQQIDYRQRKNIHWELLCAAYSLTYYGRIWLRKKISEENPHSLGISEEEASIKETTPTMFYTPPKAFNPQKKENDEFIELLTSKLDDAPNEENTIDFVKLAYNEREIIPPSHDLGIFQNIVETLKLASKRIGERENDIEDVFSDFIFLRFGQKFTMIQKKHPEEFWKNFVLNPKMKAIVNLAPYLLLARASEAAVERYFSKQKLILNYLRLKSKEDLLNARFQMRE